MAMLLSAFASLRQATVDLVADRVRSGGEGGGAPFTATPNIQVLRGTDFSR
jgi:hypothetical protein